MMTSDTTVSPTPSPPPPNPFPVAALAIREAARFVGRAAELRRLRALLQGGSVSLTGVPKIGKSSLLWQLKAAWEADGKQVLGPLDCMGLENCKDFYAELAKLVRASNHKWRSLRDTLQNTAALFLLDELDAGAEHGIGVRELGRLRAACSANPALHIVIVSRGPLKALFPDTGRGSPAYNFLQPLTLGPFSEAEAHTLLRHPWHPDAAHFDATTVQTLLTLTRNASGYHPFKLQRAAHHRYEARHTPDYDWQAAYVQDLEYML